MNKEKRQTYELIRLNSFAIDLILKKLCKHTIKSLKGGWCSDISCCGLGRNNKLELEFFFFSLLKIPIFSLRRLRKPLLYKLDFEKQVFSFLF